MIIAETISLAIKHDYQTDRQTDRYTDSQTAADYFTLCYVLITVY